MENYIDFGWKVATGQDSIRNQGHRQAFEQGELQVVKKVEHGLGWYLLVMLSSQVILKEGEGKEVWRLEWFRGNIISRIL